MAIALLPEHTTETPLHVGTATVLLVCTPVRAADGSLRTWRLDVPCPMRLEEALPPRVQPGRIILNGRVVVLEEADLVLRPGDEVFVFPTWGIAAPLGVLLVQAAIGLALSMAVTAISYLLFPPSKPHIATRDEQTFSFEGIRTAIGPGQPVPVIYGRHRIGGQLLSAAITQSQTIDDVGQPQRQIAALATPPQLTMLLALGEGPIGEVLVNTIEINGQPIANFPTVSYDWRFGYPVQDPMANFGENANTFSDGREITQAGIMYTTTIPVEAFTLNIVFNQGLYHFTTKGDKEDNRVIVQYWYRVSPSGSWAGPLPWDIVAGRTAPVRLGIRRTVPLARYDIRVEFVSAKNQVEGRDQWVPSLESVTEILHNTQSYPNTALLGIQALATDTLQGALPNITTEILGKRVRVATFDHAAEVWSDDPAWCVMDFLTDTRYGLGIPDGDIDLASFGQWSVYNNQTVDGERRHLLNYVLDRDARAQAIL